MKNAVWIWIVRALSLCVLGPISGKLMDNLHAIDGSTYATPLVSNNPISGILSLVIVFALAGLAGVIASRLISNREGVFNAGLVLCWGAIGIGQLDEVIRTAPTSSSLINLSIEGLLVVILGSLVLFTISKLSKPDVDADQYIKLSPSAIKSSLPMAALLIAAGLIASMLLAWLQVRSGLSGQSVWGGLIGATAAGVAGGMIIKNHALTQGPLSSKHTPKPPLSLSIVMIGIMTSAFIAPLLTLVVPGSEKLLANIAAGNLPGWTLMSSLAWAGGAMIGTPFGFTWVESSVARAQPAHS